MTTAEDIAKHLVFDRIDSSKTPNLISYTLKDNANGDEWKDIKVIFNGGDVERVVKLPKGEWKAAVKDGRIDLNAGLGTFTKSVKVAPRSALILKK